MTEQERRIEHNKKALEIAAADRKRRYSGIIDVELEPACLSGAAILAVSDDVYARLPKDAQYKPHISDALDKNDKPISREQPTKVITSVTADLNSLL